MKKGYTLIEILIGILFLVLLFHFINSIFLIMHSYKNNKINQWDIFKLQFQQLLIRRPIIECKHDQLVGFDYYVVFENNRIVKKPGYEILLDNAINGFFNCDHDITLYINFEGENYFKSFKVP